MITQKDIHNIIVETASPIQKMQISMQCGGDPQKIAKAEQATANVINTFLSVYANDGTDYLNRKV